MSLFRLVVVSAALCCLNIAPASAQAREPFAFAQPPVSAMDLAESYGGRVSRVGEIRELVDSEALGFLQQAGRTSSIAMDNWWSQTGAALIAENLLARVGN